MTDSTSRVLVEQRGETRWIRLNNPRQRNAYDREMAGAISDALESANEVRTVVITGVEDAFCAGGMLEPDALTTTAMRGLYRASLRMFDAIRTCPVTTPGAGITVTKPPLVTGYPRYDPY